MDGGNPAPHPHALSQRQTRLVTRHKRDTHKYPEVVFPMWLRSSAGKVSPRRIAHEEHSMNAQPQGNPALFTFFRQ
jgi:hypothetical protein